jgi:hypothetical protein
MKYKIRNLFRGRKTSGQSSQIRKWNLMRLEGVCLNGVKAAFEEIPTQSNGVKARQVGGEQPNKYSYMTFLKVFLELNL